MLNAQRDLSQRPRDVLSLGLKFQRPTRIVRQYFQRLNHEWGYSLPQDEILGHTNNRLTALRTVLVVGIISPFVDQCLAGAAATRLSNPGA